MSNVHQIKWSYITNESIWVWHGIAISVYIIEGVCIWDLSIWFPFHGTSWANQAFGTCGACMSLPVSHVNFLQTITIDQLKSRLSNSMFLAYLGSHQSLSVQIVDERLSAAGVNLTPSGQALAVNRPTTSNGIDGIMVKLWFVNRSEWHGIIPNGKWVDNAMKCCKLC